MKTQFVLFWKDSVALIDPAKYNNNAKNVLAELKKRVASNPAAQEGTVFVVDSNNLDCYVMYMSDFESYDFMLNGEDSPKFLWVIDDMVKTLKKVERETPKGSKKFIDAIPASEFKDYLLGAIKDSKKVRVNKDSKVRNYLKDKFSDPERAQAFAAYNLLRTLDEVMDIKEKSKKDHIFYTEQEGEWYVLTEKEFIDRFGEINLDNEEVSTEGQWYLVPTYFEGEPDEAGLFDDYTGICLISYGDGDGNEVVEVAAPSTDPTVAITELVINANDNYPTGTVLATLCINEKTRQVQYDDNNIDHVVTGKNISEIRKEIIKMKRPTNMLDELIDLTEESYPEFTRMYATNFTDDKPSVEVKTFVWYEPKPNAGYEIKCEEIAETGSLFDTVEQAGSNPEYAVFAFGETSFDVEVKFGGVYSASIPYNRSKDLSTKTGINKLYSAFLKETGISRTHTKYIGYILKKLFAKIYNYQTGKTLETA